MYSRFAEDMLIGLYQEDDAGQQTNTFAAIASKYGIEARQTWVQQLADEWESQGLAVVWKHIGDPLTWRIKIAAAGMRYIEQEYASLDGVGEILSPVNQSSTAENGTSGVGELMKQIIPAADRVVTVQHNQPDFVSAIEGIEEARNLISQSNSLEEAEKADTLISLDAGLLVLKNAARFAVGAMKYLVLDRLKAAFEGAIEDSFKLALTTAFTLLATFLIASL